MTTSIGPVVVGTDFSDGAAAALQEARSLADRLGAALHIVHVVDGAAAASEGRSSATSWLAASGLHLGDLIIRAGRAWVELARYAGEVGPSLLVVGSHGASGYQPLDLGATAARLSLHARCPVTIVSARAGAEPVPETKTDVAGRADAAAVARAQRATNTLTGETR